MSPRQAPTKTGILKSSPPPFPQLSLRGGGMGPIVPTTTPENAPLPPRFSRRPRPSTAASPLVNGGVRSHITKSPLSGPDLTPKQTLEEQEWFALVLRSATPILITQASEHEEHRPPLNNQQKHFDEGASPKCLCCFTERDLGGHFTVWGRCSVLSSC